MNFSFLTKFLSFDKLKSLLFNRVKQSFIDSFNNTNDSFDWSSKPNPEVVDYLKDRQLILSQKTLDRLHGNLQLELVEGIQNKESITDIKKRIIGNILAGAVV